jgi:5-bromo-4-chloroindolyl phosphate hydrolysis protein
MEIFYVAGVFLLLFMIVYVVTIIKYSFEKYIKQPIAQVLVERKKTNRYKTILKQHKHKLTKTNLKTIEEDLKDVRVNLENLRTDIKNYPRYNLKTGFTKLDSYLNSINKNFQFIKENEADSRTN